MLTLIIRSGKTASNAIAYNAKPAKRTGDVNIFVLAMFAITNIAIFPETAILV